MNNNQIIPKKRVLQVIQNKPTKALNDEKAYKQVMWKQTVLVFFNLNLIK